MLTMSIKPNCFNVAVNIKPIYLNQTRVFPRTKIFFCEENVPWKWDSKSLGLNNFSDDVQFLRSLLKSYK